MVKKRKRRRYAAPIGGLFLALAFIGLAALVAFSISLTARVLDNSREKRKIEDIIRPVLMFDPVPFENAAGIDETQILYYCMWHALMDPKSASYSISENQEMTVPASDLDAAAFTLFGPEVSLRHKSFGEYETSYYYDQGKQIYRVPITAQLYVYTPRVESIEKSGEYFNVRVGYIPPSGALTVNDQASAGEPEPDKYMIYVMKKNGGDYQLMAVRDDAGFVDETHLPG